MHLLSSAKSNWCCRRPSAQCAMCIFFNAKQMHPIDTDTSHRYTRSSLCIVLGSGKWDKCGRLLLTFLVMWQIFEIQKKKKKTHTHPLEILFINDRENRENAKTYSFQNFQKIFSFQSKCSKFSSLFIVINFLIRFRHNVPERQVCLLYACGENSWGC